jgi:hypothetical protein
MEKFQLSLLFKIIGIGSASGLVYHNEKLYLISDNSSYLYEYHIADEKLNKIALLENPQEIFPKKDKPDFESISITDNTIHIFGSGSTKDRNKSCVYKLTTGEIKQSDASGFYSECKNAAGTSDDEFNIEGVILDGHNYYLFQRGNGSSAANGIICVEENQASLNFVFLPYDLPKIKNVAATFTDAVLVDQTIYFLASAEDSVSTYLDGEVLGTIIGTIDLKTMKLTSTVQISDRHKFEGITLYSKTANQIDFLLCEDTDSEIMESDIYKIILARNQ